MARASIDRRPRRSLAFPAVLAATILATAILGRLATDPASQSAAASANPSAAVAQDRAENVPPAAAPDASLPASIACRDIASWRCRQLVLAGVVLLPDRERPVRADVYPSLVCGDDLDCPRTFLTGSSPAGSVVLTFADGGTAWVNVVMTETPRRVGETPRRFVGRLVRWFPPGA